MPSSGPPESFEAALSALTQWLEAERVPYTAIGGIAVSLLARPRATQDIDAVVWLREDQWESFLRAGERYGVVGRTHDVLEFAKRARVFLLRHQDSGISIDISCGALPFEKEMIERASEFRVGGTTIKVPTPEDLIITKAVAQRPKDLIDIASLLSVQKNLDLERVRHWVGEFAAALETPEMLDTVEALLRGHSHN